MDEDRTPLGKCLQLKRIAAELMEAMGDYTVIGTRQYSRLVDEKYDELKLRVVGESVPPPDDWATEERWYGIFARAYARAIIGAYAALVWHEDRTLVFLPDMDVLTDGLIESLEGRE